MPISPTASSGLAEALPPDLSLLQAFRFADTDRGHVARLLHWADFPRNSRVLDLGSGNGFLAAQMHDLRPDLSFCLVDSSQEKLELAHPRFDRHHADLCDVPEPAHSFDGLLCCYAMGYVDAARFSREVARLLKPGGVAFLVDMVPASGDCAELSLFGFTVRARQALETFLHDAGLALDFYMEPSDHTGWGETVFPGYFDILFGDVRPAIWRITA
ncbi:MAG TPA: class I SAM-dependent methyltransferase [Allosphingosinicella sp.]|nr:class I SAM-dependent methyltransferase [Allosphingosinicella sp.]